MDQSRRHFVRVKTFIDFLIKRLGDPLYREEPHLKGYGTDLICTLLQITIEYFDE